MARRRTKKPASSSSKSRKRRAGAAKRKGGARKNPWTSKRTGRTLKIENCSIREARKMLATNADLKRRHKRTVKRKGDCTIQSAAVKIQRKRARNVGGGASAPRAASGGGILNKALELMTWHREML